jgi:hypothetical protein
MLTTNAFTVLRNKLIADLAIRYRLPSISIGLEYPKNGGLMRYSASNDVPDQFRQAASLRVAFGLAGPVPANGSMVMRLLQSTYSLRLTGYPFPIPCGSGMGNRKT